MAASKMLALEGENMDNKILLDNLCKELNFDFKESKSEFMANLYQSYQDWSLTIEFKSKSIEDLYRIILIRLRKEYITFILPKTPYFLGGMIKGQNDVIFSLTKEDEYGSKPAQNNWEMKFYGNSEDDCYEKIFNFLYKEFFA